MRWDALPVNRREPDPDSPQHRLSLPLALCLAVAFAALIVFAVPRIVALAQAHSKYSPPADRSTCEPGVPTPRSAEPQGAE